MEEKVKPDYTSIANILELAGDGKILLPEFQRPFVWSVEQSKDLFDSIIRGIFIGTFVMSKPQFDLTCRKIDVRPRSGKGSRTKIGDHFFSHKDFDSSRIEVVLDGQQRITSIYRVLKGYDKIYFVFKKPDLIPSPNDEIKDFEQIIDSISVKPIDDCFCIELSKVFESSNWKDKDIIEKIFNPVADECSVIENEGVRERYADLLIDLKRLLSDKVKDKTLLSVFFLNMGIEKFCMFFERSNSRGTELSFIDIITAKIYKDFKLDKEIKKFKEKHKSVLFDNSIVESVVRYFSFLKVKQVDRKSILTSLDGNDFNENWEDTCSLYVKSFNFINSQRLIYHKDVIPYKTMYIPIIHFLKFLPHKDFSQMTSKQTDYFKFWFWGSLLNTRYGGGMAGSTNDIIVEDCKMLEKIAQGETFTKDYLKKFKFDFNFEDLLELTSKGAVFVGVFSIMNHFKNFRNLGNENFIDFNNHINIHHIYPTKYLEKNFGLESYENENSDTILNKMIIERIPNLKFGDKKPQEYLKQLSNPNLEASLSSHLITNPSELIDGSKSFVKFIEERSKLICQTIKDKVGVYKETFLSELEEI